MEPPILPNKEKPYSPPYAGPYGFLIFLFCHLHAQQAVRHQRCFAGDGIVHQRMRCGIHIFALLILDPGRSQHHHRTIRLQHFQGISQVELAALGTGGHAIFPIVHRSDEVPIPHIAMAGSLQGFFLAEIEARRVMAVTCTVEFLNDRIGQFKIITARIGQIRIQSTAICAGHRRHIIEGLGSSFDLQTIHACLADQVNERCCAEIVRIQNVAAILVFADFHILPRPPLLHQIVFPAARLGALAPVAASPGHITGQQTTAGHAHAHSAVHESFQFQFRRCVIPDDGNISQTQFPGKNHSLGTHLVGLGGGSIIGNTCLGRKMYFHTGGIFLGQSQYAKIGNNKGIHTGIGSVLHGLGQPVQFFIGRQGIQGQVYPAAAGVGKNAALPQFVIGQIRRCGTHAELRQRAVYGIRSVQHRIFQCFQAARRGQQFRL